MGSLKWAMARIFIPRIGKHYKLGSQPHTAPKILLLNIINIPLSYAL